MSVGSHVAEVGAYNGILYNKDVSVGVTSEKEPHYYLAEVKLNSKLNHTVQ